VPSEANAHPHFGGSADHPVLTLAHNGVIENYLALKEKLLDEGYAFSSSTDTEVIAHLVARSLAKMKLVAMSFRRISRTHCSARRLNMR
jgi:glucosamine--fructose-6-phosphate aminotransferase (isomerizing)